MYISVNNSGYMTYPFESKYEETSGRMFDDTLKWKIFLMHVWSMGQTVVILKNDVL